MEALMARRPQPRTARRALKPLRLAAVILGALLAGGAMLTHSGPSRGPVTDPLADTIRATAGAPTLGVLPHRALNADFVDVAASPDGKGYWAAASDGGVFSFGDAHFFGSAAPLHLVAPIVGIAPTPDGKGYWLAASDGGVFAYGDANFHGAARGFGLKAPIVGIAATTTGDGYWLAASDGGVFSFGDASFYGSATGVKLTSSVMAISGSRSNHGYLLVSADGGVFGFGDAEFAGSAIDGSHIATDIATVGHGYQVLRSDGSVVGFGGAASFDGPDGSVVNQHPAVAFTSRRGGGVWIALGYSPPAGPGVAPLASSSDPFLACTRRHESDTSGGYQAVSAGGTYRGAYQFLRSTWNNTARAAGRLDLVGVDPAAAAPADQDQLALFLFHQQGAGPWGGRCAGLS
jgi:hypothetical protein